MFVCIYVYMFVRMYVYMLVYVWTRVGGAGELPGSACCQRDGALRTEREGVGGGGGRG